MSIPSAADGASRASVEAFYSAYRSRDPLRIAALLDDNVEWIVSGPVEVMHMCGSWRGKAAVMDWFASRVPKIVDFIGIENLLVDGDSSALFGRLTVRHRESGRRISHRVAHFARYRGGKVVSLHCLCDSLDAAEQYIGRRIDLNPGHAMPDDKTPLPADGVVAV